MREPLQGVAERSVDADEAHAWLVEQYAAGWQPKPALPSEVSIDQLGQFSVATVLETQPADAIAPLGRTRQRLWRTRTWVEVGEALRWLLARGVAPWSWRTSWRPLGSGADRRVLRRRPLAAPVRPDHVGREAATLLEYAASGYPRNAYVCDDDCDALGLQVAGRSASTRSHAWPRMRRR